jgi:hypothetical protein
LAELRDRHSLFSGGLALGTVEGPVASRDAGIVAEDDGAGEDVDGKLVDPLVVVTLVELVAVGGMSEESGSLADFRSDGVVEGAEASGAELVPVGSLELVEDGSLYCKIIHFIGRNIHDIIRLQFLSFPKIKSPKKRQKNSFVS